MKSRTRWVVEINIHAHPRDIKMFAGDTLKLTVDAEGTDLEYQWKRNGNELENAVGPELTFPEATADQARGVRPKYLQSSSPSQFGGRYGERAEGIGLRITLGKDGLRTSAEIPIMIPPSLKLLNCQIIDRQPFPLHT